MILRTRWVVFAVLALFIVRSGEARGSGSGSSNSTESTEAAPAPVTPSPGDGTDVPATPEPTVPATPEPTVPATPEPTVPATPEPTVPATPEPTVPATPEPTVPATPEPTVPPTPGQTVPPTPGQTVPPTKELAPTRAPSPTQDPTVLVTDDTSDLDDDSGTTDDDDGGTDGTTPNEASTTGVVALSVILAALVLGNAVWLACCLRRRKPPPTPTAGGLGATEDVEVGRLRRDLETEHTRRVKAETLIHKSSGSGLRPGAFPGVRDVYQHVGHLADDALAWTEKAFAVGGSRQAWYRTTRSVLYNTFLVCREEVQRCLDERLQNLSAFLGNDEPILLSAGDEKSLDTQYVLYECLCRKYRTIVSTEPDRMDELAGLILQRCGEPADRSLANEITSGATWPSFEALMKNYLLVFVEMALQKPGIDFEDNLGDNVMFDPAEHCDLAPYSKAPTAQHCSIVFPSIRPQEAHPHPNAKIGVVRVPA